MKCEFTDHPDANCSGEVKMYSAMTQYHFEGNKNSPEDPNKDFAACEEHYDFYYDHWQEMWGEYYGAVGYPQYNPYKRRK